MELKTRVFDIYGGKYKNLYQLAKAMGISSSQVYRVEMGKRGVNQAFIIGAIRAFPEYGLDKLFYLSSNGVKGKKYSKYLEIMERK